MVNRKKIFTKKKVTGTAALLVALAIIVTGTFAWKDFSQFANSLFKADATVTEARHWVSLVDEFQSATGAGTDADPKTLEGWKSGDVTAKQVYVTSKPNDESTAEAGYNPEYKDDYKPVYVRVKLDQTLKIGGVTEDQSGDTTAINQYPTYVKWTQPAGAIKKIVDWTAGDQGEY